MVHRVREDLVPRDDRWLMRLFPDSPDPRATVPTVLLTLAVLVLASLVAVFRQTGAGALATLYAEDGSVFLAGALSHHPGIGALPDPYMGYIHSLPRLLAWLAVSMPLRWAAVVLSGASAVIVAALALLVFRSSAGHLRSTLARGLLAATLIFLPVATSEVLDNVANLHWFLIFAAFWVLLWKTDRVWEIALGVPTVFLAGASDPLTVLLAPVALLRIVALRGLPKQIFTLAWAAGLLLQAVGIVVGHAHRNLLPPLQVAKVVGWYVFDVLDRAVFGTQLLGSARSARGLALGAIGLIALGVLALVAVRSNLIRDRPLAVLAVAASVLYFAVPVILTGIDAPRYSVVPFLLVLTAVASILDRPFPANAAAPLLGARVAAIGLIAVVWVLEFQIHNARSTSNRWVDQLEPAQASCLQTPSRNVSIPIAPPGWKVDASCKDLISP